MEQGINEALEATIMAIREQIMSYFKGNAIKSFTDTNVRLIETYRSQSHRYQRWENEMHNEQVLCIGDWSVFKLQKHPSQITFCELTLERSLTMRKIRAEIAPFLSDYLAGVKLVYSDTDGSDTVASGNDMSLIKNNGFRHKKQMKYGGTESVLDFGTTVTIPFTPSNDYVRTRPTRNIYEDFHHLYSAEFGDDL